MSLCVCVRMKKRIFMLRLSQFIVISVYAPNNKFSKVRRFAGGRAMLQYGPVQLIHRSNEIFPF